jgi:hypothetical protein
MTAFNINSGANTFWDSLTGGSVNATLDSYAISNGSTLIIDTDSYLCANHSAAFGSLDTVTYSGIGGKLKIDGKNVRVIPYSTGTGNVPAIGATITQGGVSGYFLGAWSGWQSEPTASGSAMPVTGFIKIKNKTGGNFASGALTNIGASATGPDVVGWIEVRGADTGLITIPRIGQFEADGDYFQLGVTNGARGQILPCPTTATVAGVFGGVWIETSAGSGVYEKYAGVGSMVNSATTPTDERGKIVWQTTAGIRIGSDGTNNVGFLPPTGCKVLIPNVILTCCTRTAGSGSGPRVLPNATLATRYEFATSAAGDVIINGAVMQWYGNFLQAFRADITNSIVNDSMILQEVASPINVNNNIVSPTQAQLNNALNMLSCFGGGTVQNNLFARFSLAASGAYVNVANYNKNVLFTGNKTTTLLNRGNGTTGTWSCTQNVDCDWDNETLIGGRMLHVGAQRPLVNNLHYSDNFSGATGTANGHYAVDFTTGCVDSKVDGVNFLGLTNVHPYNGIVNITACYNTFVRNLGSQPSPLNFGSANACGVIINGSGNNDGIYLQRLYVNNTRTGPWAFVNSDNLIDITDVRSDYADTSVMAGLNATMKNVALTGATTGQTSVYGTHFKTSFVSATVGKIEVLCNEPTVDSASQCYITSGTPKFNSVGQIALTSVGQEITWEMPFFAKSITALANLAPTLTGTNTGNLIYEFQYDIGAGYNGTWLVLNAANQNAVGAITPSVGIKLKIRARCSVASAGNLLTNISIPTITSSVNQGLNFYPMDEVTVTVSANTSLLGAEVRVYDMDNIPTGSLGTELSGTESCPGSNYSFQSSSGNLIWIQIMKNGYVEFGQSISIPALDTTLSITLVADNNT